MDDITLYFSLMNGIGDSLQSSLASIWFAAQADLLGCGAIVIASFVLAWSLLTWAALNTPEARAEARDERQRLRVWTLILLGVDVAALSEACPPPPAAAEVDDRETLQAKLRDAEAELASAHISAVRHGWNGGPSNRHADAQAAIKALRRRLARCPDRSVDRSVGGAA